jgi:hypothetical protein
VSAARSRKGISLPHVSMIFSIWICRPAEAP